MLGIKENVYKYLLPNLLEIQRISFCWFLEKGFSEANIRDLPENKQSMYNYQRNSRIFCKTI